MSAQIPLRWRDGSIRAFAIVDDEDEERVEAFRWSINGNGYPSRIQYGRAANISIQLHRFVLELDRDDPREVDHVNHDVLDSRKANLRLCTRAENAQNRRPNRNAASRYRGVFRSRNRWKAEVRWQGKYAYLGTFDTEEQAAEAASAFRREVMPFTIEVAT